MLKNFHVLLLNGPNLNILGKREINLYGKTKLNNMIHLIKKKAKKLNIKLTHFQSNAEHELINKIQKTYKNINFILFNPAAFTHTSIALRDTLLSVKIPFYEIHITNIYAREHFRKKSYFSDIAIGVISGFQIDSYFFALESANKYLLKIKKNKSITK